MRAALHVLLTAVAGVGAGVAVERAELLVALHGADQVGTNRHQVAGTTGRAVEPAEQLLPPRLGCEMQVTGVVVARLRAPGLDRLGDLLPVGAELTGKRLEERQPPRLIELMVAVEHLARHRGTGSLAAAR